MGLAPYAGKWSPTADFPLPPRLTSGSLLLGGKSDGGSGEDAFHVDWEALESLPHPNELGKEADDSDIGDQGSDLRGLGSFYVALAARAQEGLEEAALAFVSGLRDRTGEKNVCLCGGVALNSVLNGKIAREVCMTGVLCVFVGVARGMHRCWGLELPGRMGCGVVLPRFASPAFCLLIPLRTNVSTSLFTSQKSLARPLRSCWYVLIRRSPRYRTHFNASTAPTATRLSRLCRAAFRPPPPLGITNTHDENTKQAGFERVFVPPCPGDEGVAVGCAAFGWHQRRLLLPPSGDTPTLAGEEEKDVVDAAKYVSKATAAAEEEQRAARPGAGPLRAPFWGRGWSKDDVDDEIAEWESWVDVREVAGVEVRMLFAWVGS